jgi:hypothetical protein
VASSIRVCSSAEVDAAGEEGVPFFMRDRAMPGEFGHVSYSQGYCQHLRNILFVDSLELASQCSTAHQSEHSSKYKPGHHH